MGEKVVGVLVLYNPDENIVQITKTNLMRLDDIVIVCNGQISKPINDGLKTNGAVNYLSNLTNVGLAKATNQGIAFALQELGADFIVLLDQDSTLPENYRSLVGFYNSNPNSVGIVSPFYKDAVLNEISLNIVFRKIWFRRFGIDKLCIQNDMPIASGSLIHKSVVERFGYMNDEYFIDYVDNEYAMRIRQAGFFNYTYPQIVMDHHLGSPTLHHFFGLRIITSNHSPLRKYYITRNRLNYIRKFFAFKPSIFIYEVLAIAIDLGKIIAYEKNKISKLRYIFLGAKDFLAGNYGQCMH